MKKFKQYSFFIGIVGAILTVVGVVLDFFELIKIMPIITEVLAAISAVLVSFGVIQKQDSTNKSFEEIKEEIEKDLSNSKKDND